MEEAARDYPLTGRILARLPQATVVPVSDYKLVFNRPRQSFAAQQHAKKLVLAVKRPPFIYPGAQQCQSFGHANPCYATPILNCVYGCDYCFLQGLYNSANIVVFVNTSEFFEVLERQGAMHLSISYENDLLALELLTGLCREWIEFARTRSTLALEVRTKCANFAAIDDVQPCDRVTLAWTLSPDLVIERYEHGTSAVDRRLAAVRQAAEAGWPVRLCFDPLIPIANWRQIYNEFFRTVATTLEQVTLKDIALGPFRLGETHWERIRKLRRDCDLFYGNPSIDSEELLAFAESCVSKWFPRVPVYPTTAS